MDAPQSRIAGSTAGPGEQLCTADLFCCVVLIAAMALAVGCFCGRSGDHAHILDGLQCLTSIAAAWSPSAPWWHGLCPTDPSATSSAPTLKRSCAKIMATYW